jgi:VanZ family protein
MAVLCRVALLGVILLLIVLSYIPFSWDPPRTVRNQVTRSADGSLRFGEMNYARTSGTPAWLQDARTSGFVQIQLEADPQSLQEDASIMMLASDYWDTDFAIGQDHSDLLVWVRRPGSDANGDPPFAVDGVLQPQRWNDVDVILQRDDIRIEVNGKTRLTGRLPTDSARVWSQGEIALGDEVHGGGPWQGEIRLAEVRTSGHAVDYVQPGILSIPKSYLYLPDHILPFPPANLGQWWNAFLDLLSFIPLGFLIVWARRPPARPVSATLIATALAVVLAAGKLLFHGRHTSVADVVLQAVGGLLGALLASRLAHAKRYRLESAGRTLGASPGTDAKTRDHDIVSNGAATQPGSPRPAARRRHPR